MVPSSQVVVGAGDVLRRRAEVDECLHRVLRSCITSDTQHFVVIHHGSYEVLNGVYNEAGLKLTRTSLKLPFHLPDRSSFVKTAPTTLYAAAS